MKCRSCRLLFKRARKAIRIYAHIHMNIHIHMHVHMYMNVDEQARVRMERKSDKHIFQQYYITAIGKRNKELWIGMLKGSVSNNFALYVNWYIFTCIPAGNGNFVFHCRNVNVNFRRRTPTPSSHSSNIYFLVGLLFYSKIQYHDKVWTSFFHFLLLFLIWYIFKISLEAWR